MSVSINGTNGLTFGDGSAQNTGGYTGFRNRIINGAMMIDQRNAGASVTANDGVFGVDRFKFSTTQNGKGTLQQSTTAFAGFINSLLFTSSSAYSVLSSDNITVQQRVEGFNCSDLAWGTANAASVTLSFWVRSSLTGTFGGSIANSAFNRSYPFTFTVNSANVFEYKTITIIGDTAGTWLTNNGVGMYVNFNLGSGSTYSGTAGAWASATYTSATGATSIVGTSGATFYITGVQLEKGSVATPFEHRPYGMELSLCQRYYHKPAEPYENYTCFQFGSSAYSSISLPTTMRAAPTVVYTGGTTWYQGGLPYTYTNLSATGSVDFVRFSGLVSGGTNGGAGTFYPNFTASAEL